ncbi:hypothetical protein H5410_001290 [Solanum commersonii]|uniref:Isopentenyltransferase n=1 Tax=Solanum commersonii TaxID=4109 RepID=A0A9J6AYA1_SOLCO|nr:hypothetical protein H5410_001290 [Solanum commersonii]
MWPVYHIIASDVFKEDRKEVVDEAWRNNVWQPCLDIVKRFHKNHDHNITKMNTFINNNNNNKKVEFIMGAIGTGKSHLFVDLPTHFRGEIINSNKMQEFKGLEIVTKKTTHAEKQGVRHYLLGEIEPDSNYTAEDFCLKSIVYIEIFLKTQCVPIIVGGSNLYIEKLVDDPVFMFKYKYDSCFIWIDVEQSVLNRRVDTRVDEMVNAAKMNTFINNKNNKKVVFIMGATGTGKSRLSVDLATHFRGEIINSDKMQVFKGLEIVTNKITHAKKQGVRHYLLEQSVLNRRVDTRVDEMVNAGLVDEVRQIFIPDADYTKGIRRSIGVPEMAKYIREEKNIDGDDESNNMILQASISSIKRNTPKMNTFINNNKKKKVVFIMGATGTGKSRLSVDLATPFRGEVINSDKMQIFKGLQIVTNKITYSAKQGVRHYLLGLVDEVRQIFILDADYTKGIQWSIGVPEMAKYLREEKNIDRDDESKKMILQASIPSIKRNTRILICNQLDKIQPLTQDKMWPVHHISATDIFKEDGKEVVVEAWRNTVLQPCLDIVKKFLKTDGHNISFECT